MRKLIVGALVGVLALAITAIAMAETVQHYSQNFTAKKTNALTGTTFQTDSIDEQNTDRNKQPKRVTNFDITFPKGTKINYKALAVCKATESDFTNAGSTPDKACPTGSKVGTGNVKARIPFQLPGQPEELTGTVDGYNAKGGLLLWVVVQSPIGNQTLLIKPKLKGLTLKTAVPRTCVPPGTPENDCQDSNGQSQEAILTFFKLNVKSLKGKKTKKPYMLTPKTCTGSKWTFSAKITYADGTSINPTSDTPCKK
ncbi:MAG: hypothetical protein QOJ07_1251 [Thermoleophilaceae bacterium]|jgi:hypothetical protein|nr:hypothetical protein [Thermoleophilaceae bacterium]